MLLLQLVIDFAVYDFVPVGRRQRCVLSFPGVPDLTQTACAILDDRLHDLITNVGDDVPEHRFAPAWIKKVPQFH